MYILLRTLHFSTTLVFRDKKNYSFQKSS